MADVVAMGRAFAKAFNAKHARAIRVVCPYCDRPAELVTGFRIYPGHPRLYDRKYWHCASCDAYVGCHAADSGFGDGTIPLGHLANAELRSWRSRAHDAFDPLWKSRAMRRTEAYAWLAGELGISVANCHIGMFDIDACRNTVEAINRYSKNSSNCTEAWNKRIAGPDEE